MLCDPKLVGSTVNIYNFIQLQNIPKLFLTSFFRVVTAATFQNKGRLLGDLLEKRDNITVAEARHVGAVDFDDFVTAFDAAPFSRPALRHVLGVDTVVRAQGDSTLFHFNAEAKGSYNKQEYWKYILNHKDCCNQDTDIISSSTNC